MSLKILLNGAGGRMGQAIMQAAAEAGAEVSLSRDVNLPPVDPQSLDWDVAIDFTVHDATIEIAEICARMGRPLVIGTTGHQEEEKEAVRRAVADIPVVWAGNYSVGINLLVHLTRHVAAVLDDTFDPEIIEAHHRLKKDAPSGTAEHLVDAVLAGKGWGREALCHGRQGIVGERAAVEVGVHAVRGGDIVGEHTVLFAGPGERVELTHRATDRMIFARGAVRAAHWLPGKPPGIYGMPEVLGLSSSEI